MMCEFWLLMWRPLCSELLCNRRFVYDRQFSGRCITNRLCYKNELSSHRRIKASPLSGHEIDRNQYCSKSHKAGEVIPHRRWTIIIAPRCRATVMVSTNSIYHQPFHNCPDGEKRNHYQWSNGTLPDLSDPEQLRRQHMTNEHYPSRYTNKDRVFATQKLFGPLIPDHTRP